MLWYCVFQHDGAIYIENNGSLFPEPGSEPYSYTNFFDIPEGVEELLMYVTVINNPKAPGITYVDNVYITKVDK